MEFVVYHGTKVDIDGDLKPGDTSFDRMIGPHFSKTPALANLFASPKNVGRKGQGKRTGGRVFRMKLAGPVYQVNQDYSKFPRGYGWVATETGRRMALFAWDHLALAHDAGWRVLQARPDLLARYAQLTGTDAQRCLAALRKTNTWEMVGYMSPEAGDGLMRDIASAYRDILVAQGYVAIEYVNTAKREQVGDLDDHVCFIALQRPQDYFEAAAP